ncbi:MAG: MoaF N-terminal domain-containing protein, partial [Oscillospiraceae bacterium]|nr:MoaF N-terminal domain-containing protein [Oscillospiraceae bacterium]
MGKINRKFIGLSQFRGPFCFELAGKHFHFVLDDGREYSLFFPDGETVQWAEKGKPYLWDSYECLKGDDTTYFVTYQPSGMERFRFNWIIDTAQRLVTLDCME